MDDGYEVKISTWPVWCHQCKEFTDGENILPFEALQDVLKKHEKGENARDLEARTEAWRQQHAALIDKYPMNKADKECIAQETREREQRDLLQARRTCAWRMLRLSPPRCLQCGATDIVRFTHSEE